MLMLQLPPFQLCIISYDRQSVFFGDVLCALGDYPV